LLCGLAGFFVVQGAFEPYVVSVLAISSITVWAQIFCTSQVL
jgi:hypothetical protein